VITADLRRAIRAAAEAAGLGNPDPGLRATGLPGQYAAGLALTSPYPKSTAGTLAAQLSRQPWIAAVEVTGPGYLTVTVTAAALAALPGRIAAAGPACAASDALAGTEFPAPPEGDPLAAVTWQEARVALAARVTARLAAAAGATITNPQPTERVRPALPPQPPSALAGGGATGGATDSEIAAAVAFAGPDAVTFMLARAVPGKPLRIDKEEIARHVPGNPAYAVRYAHARAAAELRWARADVSRGDGPPFPMAAAASGPDPAAGTIDALSWLPERVAIAARRGRPDEFARYLEELASVTIEALIPAPRPVLCQARPRSAGPWGSDRLALAEAARTGIAAGLELLGVGAPARLLAGTRLLAETVS
jgi:arginyl-tRNA synthetase